MHDGRNGLENVLVADTRTSGIDGARGRLTLCGYDVERLAATVRFEDVCGLLWRGELPTPEARAELAAGLGRGRERAYAALPGLRHALETADPMDALRSAVSQLGVPEELPFEEQAALLTGGLAVLIAAWQAQRSGSSLVAPDPAAGHVADYLRLLRAEPVCAERTRALDAYFVTVVDHGMNASTFTARVIASTRSDRVSAVVGALGALKGPAHGGAPGPVLDMIEAIGAPERATAWIESALAAGERIMGIGHRVYRARDPRAAVLESAIERLEARGIATRRLALARAVERAALEVLRARKPDRLLHANVEFYTAVLLSAVGLPKALFTPTFAASRIVGWLAHVREQSDAGRLIRPTSRYTGPEPDDLPRAVGL